jgi:large subunit ribosomal protein L17
MRHRNYGRKLSRNTSHRRALLRNLVTSLILEERIETTVAKAKAARGIAEKMISLGKRGDLAARRQAAAYCMGAPAVKKLFEEVAPRYSERSGGYTRLTPSGWRKGDGGDIAVLELVGTEVLSKRAEARAKRVERRRQKAEEEARQVQPAGAPSEEKGEKDSKDDEG